MLRFKKNGYKKKVRTMQAMWSAVFNDSDNEYSCSESRSEQVLNLAIMTQVEEGPSTINVDEIIASKNITDNIIIELLKRITLSKNKELESKQQESVSTSSTTEMRYI
jgi:hypothetical protein